MEREPTIKVGIAEGAQTLTGNFQGTFSAGETPLTGTFTAQVDEGAVLLTTAEGAKVRQLRKLRASGAKEASFTLAGITIGRNFHWQREQEQTFPGDLVLLAREDGTLTVINELPLETYLTSVISSEMRATAPAEFLKAHAVTSRSWLAAMLARKKRPAGGAGQASARGGEIIRWYDREDHDLFDVCADDHCQRYHGLGGVAEAAAAAVEATRGIFLVYGDEICDARYHKACGGRTENFATAWEDVPHPYLISVADAEVAHPPLRTEHDAQRWMLSAPPAWCNTADAELLQQALPSFDRETQDFFRWQVAYERGELEEILRERSGIDFGVLKKLVPLTRGPSGRIARLHIEGSRAAVTVGKELEIRRWLSRSHLLSSAFVVTAQKGADRDPARFVLHGAGWGHGVGLCQIGAAVMAQRGFSARQILAHYFRKAEWKSLY